MQTNHFTVAVAEQRTTLGIKHWIAAGLSCFLLLPGSAAAKELCFLFGWQKLHFIHRKKNPQLLEWAVSSLQHTDHLKWKWYHSSQATQHKAGCPSCDHAAMDRTKPRTLAVGLKPHTEWNWEEITMHAAEMHIPTVSVETLHPRKHRKYRKLQTNRY